MRRTERTRPGPRRTDAQIRRGSLLGRVGGLGDVQQPGVLVLRAVTKGRDRAAQRFPGLPIPRYVGVGVGAVAVTEVLVAVENRLGFPAQTLTTPSQVQPNPDRGGLIGVWLFFAGFAVQQIVHTVDAFRNRYIPASPGTGSGCTGCIDNPPSSCTQVEGL